MYFLGFTWNPNETLFNIGAIQIKYYNLLWIVSFILGWYIMKRIFLKEKKSKEQLDSLFIHTILATMLGARLGHVFFYGWNSYYKDHLIEILLPIRERTDGTLLWFIEGYEFTGFSGLASHGAAIGIIIGMYFFVRKYPEFKMLWILDKIVIPVSIGAFCVRLGNFFNSEINGKIVDKSFIFATRFIKDSDDNLRYAKELENIPYRHPAQLYEAFCYVLVFLILNYLYWKTDKKEKPGFLFGTFMVLLWTVRFFIEYVKKSQGGFEESLGYLSTGQWLSIPFIFVGIYFMFRHKISRN